MLYHVVIILIPLRKISLARKPLTLVYFKRTRLPTLYYPIKVIVMAKTSRSSFSNHVLVASKILPTSFVMLPLHDSILSLQYNLM